MQPKRDLLEDESPPILHDELITDILSRLPVKSLMRFRCVCKSWKSLISDPQFVKLHLRQSSAKIGDLAHLRLLFEREIDDTDNKIVSSCSYNELIENPTAVVNEQNSHFQLKNRYRAIGTCNGLISFVGVPLGERKKVKTAAAGLYDDYHPHPVKVYNLGSDSWRSLPVFPIFPSPLRSDGIYLNGSLIWSGHHYVSDFDRSGDFDRFAIVSLDLGTETYAELSVPPLDMDSNLIPSLALLRDCLCVCHMKNNTHFVLWQFGVDKSWTCLLNVSYRYLLTPQQSLRCVLCMSGNGNVLLLIEDEVVLYDLRE
ncbi:F-box-like domain superfamily [Sesbania bispinosa]|nr:F-box-like domain superfamily [Sesbania bispinosa]